MPVSFPATQPGDGARPIELVPDRPIRGVAEDAFGFVAYADAFALLVNDRSTASVKASPELLELLLEPPALTGVVGRIVRLDDTKPDSTAVETPERGLRPE